MPIRSNPEEVKHLIGDDDADIIVQIVLASQMVDSMLSGSSLGDPILKQIEMYLAAHIYSYGTPEVVRESYGDASFQYATSSGKGEGLCSTKWGQMASALDTTGTLLRSSKQKVLLHVI